MKKLSVLFCLALFVWMGDSSVQAASATYSLGFDGLQEVPSAGDPDGTGSGTISLNDVTGEVSWDFSYADIATLTLMHIHGPNGSVGLSAPAFISLGVNTSGGAGTLVDSQTATLADVAAVLANPSDFYVNIHTTEFGPGAIRGQLGTEVPEPTCIALLALGLVGLLPRRRRNR